MADVFTKEKRSEIMSLIRAKNTGIEKKVFSHLRKNRIHFQRHYSKVPGKPDIAVPSKKIAVFIDGDFWHGYKFDQWRRRIPREYWREKIASNIARDTKNRRALRRKGWKVMRVWGHELVKKPEQTLARIQRFLKP
ncbi:MAG: very short patch repair endonuclease [Candidatus Kaiserbacteria bacterium]|nr:very short patch repair endonuclease [Candidatus Kaiserbacteria bacterium]